MDYGFKYKVRATINGKSVGAGKVVTLKIAGKTLKAKTDKNGYITLKFTKTYLPKTYTVTWIDGESKTTNAVTYGSAISKPS